MTVCRPVSRAGVLLRCLAGIGSLVAGFALSAAEDGTPHQAYRPSGRAGFVDSDVQPPPLSGDLLEVHLNLPTYPHRVFIDPGALRVTDGGVVRYTVVVRSDAGVENIYYEGIRCAEREFRTYAFAMPDSGWSIIADADWQPLVDRGAHRYRYQFYRGIFCNGAAGPWNRSAMLRHVRYGSEQPFEE